MKRFRFINKKKYFVKILLYFIVLTIIPNSIIYALFSYNNRKFFEKNVIDSYKNSLNNTVISFDIDMKQLKDNIEKFVCQQDTYLYLNNMEYRSIEENSGPFDDYDLKLLPQYVYSKHYFYLSLESFKNSYEYVESVYVYDSRSDILYDSSQSIKRFADYYDTDWYYIAKDSSIFPLHIDVRKKHSVQNLSKTIKVCTIIYYYQGVYFVVNIDYEKLFESNINQLIKTNDESASFLVINYENKVLIEFNKIDSLDTTRLKSMMIADDNDNIFKIKDDKGKDYIALYLKSPFYGWIFTNIIPEADINLELANIFILTTLIFFLIIFLFTFLSLFISRSVYKPIQKILNLMNSFNDTITESNSNTEIEVIESNIQKLYIEKNRLQKSLNDSLPIYKEKFLFDLLYGQINELNKITEKLDYFGLKFPIQDYYVAVIDLNTAARRSQNCIENGILIIKTYILNVFLQLFDNNTKGFATEINDDCIGLAYNCKRDEKGTFCELLEKVKDEIISSLKISISIGVSDYTADLLHLKDSLEQAVLAKNYKISFSDNEIICFNEIRQIKGNSISNSYKMGVKEKLINYMICGEKERAVDELNNMMNYINTRKHEILYNEAVDMLAGILDEICSTFNGLEGNNRILKKLNLELIMKLPRQNISRCFIEVISDICDEFKLKLTGISNRTKIINKVYDYVEEKFSGELGVENIAKHVNLNYAYLSRMFKEHTGINLGEYIEKVRIEKAKELILTTNLKIHEISERVGYVNCNYFSKVYKKYTGLSPEQYRKKMVEKKNMDV